MLLYIKRSFRASVSQCSNRYAKATNLYMGLNYNTLKEESYLSYSDINDQFRAAMSAFLPYRNIK